MRHDRSVWILLAIVGTSVLLAGGPAAPLAAAPRQITLPAPVCAANTPPTPAQTEGPFYKANSPERTSLIESGMSGTKIIVTGYVLGKDCTRLAKARLDFWQADDRGNYDNAGYRLRGHQFTDSSGVYYLETILPGLYPGRTRHIHVKVQFLNGPTLTTQLYFPSEAQNQTDGIFNRALLVDLRDIAGGKAAFFTFVLDVRR